MLTMNGCLMLSRISLSILRFSKVSVSKTKFLRMHFMAYCFFVYFCYTRNTLPKVPVPTSLRIWKSSSFASYFFPNYSGFFKNASSRFCKYADFMMLLLYRLMLYSISLLSLSSSYADCYLIRTNFLSRSSDTYSNFIDWLSLSCYNSLYIVEADSKTLKIWSKDLSCTGPCHCYKI